MTEPSPWRVIARNSFADSENVIHSDGPARTLGFRSGLVAGVTIYGYLVRPAVARWGCAWLERGTADVRFRRPVFDGDVLDVLVDREQGDAITASVSSAGEAVAAGTFGLPAAPAGPAVVGELRERPLPAVRARPDPSGLGRLDALGSFRMALARERCASCLAGVANDLDLFKAGGFAHPALLLDGANLLLMANVELGPWLHTGSAVVHRRPLQVGTTLSFRGKIVEVGERNARPTLALDVVVFDETGPAATIHHEVIYDAAR